MSNLQALILGILQGLTEFLPVSSSGHLIILPKIMGWAEHSSTFDILMHMASFVAILIVMRGDIFEILQRDWKLMFEQKSLKYKLQHAVSLKILIAAIPAGIIGLLFEDQIDALTDNIYLVAGMLISIGVIMIIVDFMKDGNKRKLCDVGFINALIVGLMQVLAFVRGTSRSGVTMLAGISQGMNYRLAAKFSFLTASILMFGVSLVGAKKLIAPVGMIESNGALAIGFFSALISSLFAAKFLFWVLNKHNLKWFGIYRIVLGLVVLFIAL